MDPGNAIVIQGVSMTFIAAAAAAKEMRARARMDTCNDACMHACMHELSTDIHRNVKCHQRQLSRLHRVGNNAMTIGNANVDACTCAHAHTYKPSADILRNVKCHQIELCGLHRVGNNAMTRSRLEGRFPRVSSLLDNG